MLVLPNETLPEGALHLLICIGNALMIILILIRLTSNDSTLEINASLV